MVHYNVTSIILINNTNTHLYYNNTIITIITLNKNQTIRYIGECLSDWIKHAFISKFNHIDASVYEDFSRVLRKDILSYQKEKDLMTR